MQLHSVWHSGWAGMSVERCGWAASKMVQLTSPVRPDQIQTCTQVHPWVRDAHHGASQGSSWS